MRLSVKRQSKLMLAVGFLSLSLLGVGCLQPTATTNTSTTDTTLPINAEPGSWVPTTQGPWDGAIYLAESEDGLTFSGRTLLQEQAGVPNLLRRSNGDLILTYQFFSSESEAMFDVIAYSLSSDEGETWSDPAAVTFSGLPSPIAPDKKPMDPTLVELPDGSLRIYFTYHAKGLKNAVLYSATAADGKITSPFVVTTTPGLSVSGLNLLDPAVTFFDGVWHHYSWQDGNEKNIHSTSTDGLSFTQKEDIVLAMDFLGQVIPFGNGLRFYGTGKGGVVSAFSEDGYIWTMDSGSRVQGADPGIAQLKNGDYLMIYTSMNFNSPSP